MRWKFIRATLPLVWSCPYSKDLQKTVEDTNDTQNPLRQKCPNTEFSLVRIFLYSDQKILRIWTILRRLKMTCAFSNLSRR